MAQAVDLPEKVWSALQQAAKASGLTPAGWIAAHLPAPADTDVASAPADEQGAEDLEPPTYASVPLERAGAVRVVCVAGKEVPRQVLVRSMSAAGRCPRTVARYSRYLWLAVSQLISAVFRRCSRSCWPSSTPISSWDRNRRRRVKYRIDIPRLFVNDMYRHSGPVGV